MSESSSALQTISFLGLSASFWASGAHFSASQLTLPILYRLPDAISTDFFTEFYYRGLATLVPLSVFSSACSAVASYLDPDRRSGYLIAAGLTIASLPWTLVLMRSVNARLIQLHESNTERAKARQGEVTELLKKWKWMNNVRAAFGFAGGIACFLTMTNGW